MARLTRDDGLMIWRARDVYRMQTHARGLMVLVFGMQGLGFALSGQWLAGAGTLLLEWVLLRVTLWGVRWGLRWMGSWRVVRWLWQA